MLARSVLFLFWILLSTSSTGLAVELWRPPREIPPECTHPRYEMFLFDISISMSRLGRMERTTQDAAEYILRALPPCALAIIATFGMTADVVQSEFVFDVASGMRSAAAVRSLKATHRYTNLDEAAKLIELVGLQLKDVYGSSADGYSVHVYTDFLGAPSLGKPQFSLSQFLEDRLNSQHRQVVATNSSDGVILNLIPRKPLPAAELRSDGDAMPQVLAGVALLALLGLLGGVVLWWRSRPPGSSVEGRVEALLVAERTENDGRVVFAAERRIVVAEGVPVLFSTDPNSATYVVAATTAAAQGELFIVEPRPGGRALIRSAQPRLTVNDEPLRHDRRLEINLREPLQIRLGPRVFDITGIFARPQGFQDREDVFGAEPLRRG